MLKIIHSGAHRYEELGDCENMNTQLVIWFEANPEQYEK